MTQAKLAMEINTKQQVVSRLEDEHHIPSFTTLWKVANVFGKKTGYKIYLSLFL